MTQLCWALVSAANQAAAIVAANALALARGFNDVFSPSGWVITDIATGREVFLTVGRRLERWSR